MEDKKNKNLSISVSVLSTHHAVRNTRSLLANPATNYDTIVRNPPFGNRGKEKYMRLIINTDGGSRGNPGPAAAAFVIKDSQGKEIKKQGSYLGITTNNVAEYTAVADALEWILQNEEDLKEVEQINFFLDSQLVVNQLLGIYKIKNMDLAKIIMAIKQKEKQLAKEITYTYVPRSQNKEADLHVNVILDQTSRSSE